MDINFDDYNLTPEQKAKVLACETPEKVLEFAKGEGFNLTMEQLENISGGSAGWGECSKYDPEDPSFYDC